MDIHEQSRNSDDAFISIAHDSQRAPQPKARQGVPKLCALVMFVLILNVVALLLINESFKKSQAAEQEIALLKAQIDQLASRETFSLAHRPLSLVSYGSSGTE